jgi:hypothetical protein
MALDFGITADVRALHIPSLLPVRAGRKQKTKLDTAKQLVPRMNLHDLRLGQESALRSRPFSYQRARQADDLAFTHGTTSDTRRFSWFRPISYNQS